MSKKNASILAFLILCWSSAMYFPQPGLTQQPSFTRGGLPCTPTGLNVNCRGSLSVATVLPAGFQNVSAWGDSLTAGTNSQVPYPTQLATLLNSSTVFNGGVGGDTSTQIATRMLAATGSYGQVALIWAGSNNPSPSATVLADVASMVAALTAPKRFLVLSTVNNNAPSGQSGGTVYNQIIALNALLAAAYPSNYLDIRSILVSDFNAGLPQDVIDHANDVPPTSLRTQSGAGTLTAGIDAVTCNFALTYTLGSLAAGQTLTIGTEAIYVSTNAGNSVTGCIRGYAGTTAAAHLIGVAFTGIDQIHLTTAGYLIVAQQVNTALAATSGEKTVLTAENIPGIFADPPIMGRLYARVGVGQAPANLDRLEVQDVNGNPILRFQTGNADLSILNAAGFGLGTLDPNLGFVAGSSRGVAWRTTASSLPGVGSVDLGLNRNAAGVLEVNNGTSGTFRDLIVRDYFTGTNCSSSASPAVCGSAAAGSVAVPVGTNQTLQVNTSAVTANSQIFLQSDSSLGTKLGITCNATPATEALPIAVTTRSAGVSFTLLLTGISAATQPCYSYFIVN